MDECELIEIIQGERQKITWRFRDTVGDPVSLVGISEITLCYKSGSGTVSHTLTAAEVAIDDVEFSKVSSTLTELETPTLDPAKSDTVAEAFLEYDSGEKRKVQQKNIFVVIEAC